MSSQQNRLPDAGAIRQTLHDTEGNAGRFELLTQDLADHNAVAPLRCAVIRSVASKRVYLFVHDGKPVRHWHQDLEIIGFDGLQPRLAHPSSGTRRPTLG